MVALDWCKAFDSVHVDALLDSLRRFGIPSQFITFIGSMLRGRQFFVQDHGQKSRLRKQHSGVSQGCTLSPLLFIIVMSVLMHDATQMLSGEAALAYSTGDLADVVYADDTLLIGVNTKFLAQFVVTVTEAGKGTGLNYIWESCS